MMSRKRRKNIANEVTEPDDKESRNNIKMGVNSDNSNKYLGVSSKIARFLFLARLFIGHLRILSSH